MTQDLKTISFQGAIAFTASWLAQVVTEQTEEQQIEHDLKMLLSHRDGVRGFFVVYLTGESPLVDQPPAAFIRAFAATANEIKEILVKNVAMSAAMAIAHNRNNDADNQAASARVTRRSQNILRLLDQTDAAEPFQQEKEALLAAIATQKGDYATFLQRWKYDEEQQTVIKAALEAI